MTDALPTPDPLDKDECFVFEERLALLLAGYDRPPTEEEIDMALEDVRRFRKERSD